MSDVHFSYPNPRPRLVIECVGGGSLGNCYSSATWRVTATERLSAHKLAALNAAGVLGMGQEFYVRSQADGKEEPAGEDDVPCVVTDRFTGKPTGDAPINPYSGKLYEPIKCPFFVYLCESRCDSGD